MTPGALGRDDLEFTARCRGLLLGDRHGYPAVRGLLAGFSVEDPGAWPGHAVSSASAQLRALFVGDDLRNDVQGAVGVGMSTMQALWFRADDTPGSSPTSWRSRRWTSSALSGA